MKCFSALTCGPCIVEKNPKKFKIDAGEVAERQQFIERSRTFVKVCELPDSIDSVCFSTDYIFMQYLMEDKLQE